MRCPFCKADRDRLKVVDSRAADNATAIRRRRECLECQKRFTTYEHVEPGVKLTVVKTDGRRQPWDRAKIVAGLGRACYKRSVPEAAVAKLAEDVEEDALRHFDKEVPAGWVGERVMGRLRELDEVAYVRFASVYRRFATVEELLGEAQQVLRDRTGDRTQIHTDSEDEHR